MTAYNIVRFRVRPGLDEEFIEAHRMAEPDFAGMRRFSMINTGPGTYCIVGEWDEFDDIVAARPGMIEMLDSFRHLLEDLGDELGVTDPISGAAILEMEAPAKKKAKKKAAKRAKPAKKKAAKRPAKKKAAKRPAKKKAAKRRKR